MFELVPLKYVSPEIGNRGNNQRYRECLRRKGKKYMIVLITGASHTGKTALAQKLPEKYKYPYLSIDHLKMGLIRSGYTKLTPEDDNELTDFLWPIICE